MRLLIAVATCAGFALPANAYEAPPSALFSYSCEIEVVCSESEGCWSEVGNVHFLIGKLYDPAIQDPNFSLRPTPVEGDALDVTLVKLSSGAFDWVARLPLEFERDPMQVDRIPGLFAMMIPKQWDHGALFFFETVYRRSEFTSYQRQPDRQGAREVLSYRLTNCAYVEG